MMKKGMKITVFYYSQTGQALNAAHHICQPLEAANGADGIENKVIYKEIIPLQHYPFPWNRKEFFNCFPESRLEFPPSGIQPIDFSDIEDTDLVIVAGQSWFLSPSLPLQSFFSDSEVRHFLNGHDVIFVNACRNMWLMTSRRVKAYLQEIGARLVGHIVLQDEAPNLISVLTVIRWLMYGKKKGTNLLPNAGVSEANLAASSRFGIIIQSLWTQGNFSHIQDHFLTVGAIKYNPSVLFLEKAGHRTFGLWAKYIRRKGGSGDNRRQWRLSLFYGYLLFALFVVSPFAQLFFWLTYPLQQVRKHQKTDCSV